MRGVDMPMPESKRVIDRTNLSLDLPRGTVAALAEKASERGVSVSEMANTALAEWLEQSDKFLNTGAYAEHFVADLLGLTLAPRGMRTYEGSFGERENIVR